MNIRLVWVYLPILLLLSACSPAPVRQTAWQAVHLRALDPADAALPTQDLLAVYTQAQDDLLWLRLDLLEIEDLPNFDLYLAFDWKSDGSRRLPVEANSRLAWDTLLVIPARGSIQVLAPGSEGNGFVVVHGYRVLVFRDPLQDMLEIRLQPSQPADELAPLNRIQKANLEVWLTAPGSRQIADQFSPFSLNAPPPSPVPALLAFWNTMPAYTPRQALRRWDGAHSGPAGGRHGLSGLLQAVERTRSPLFLLDLNQPASLSALQLVGADGQIQALKANNLLHLPQVIPAIPAHPEWNPPARVGQEFISQDRAISQRFGIDPTSMVYLPSGEGSLPGFDPSSRRSQPTLIWIHSTQGQPSLHGLPFPSRPVIQAGQLIIPLPPLSHTPPEHQQATPDGLALESRRALIQAAIRVQQAPFNPELMILGGDLTQANWGNPQMARATLEYLQNHPWIHLLNLDQIRQVILPSGSAPPIEMGHSPAWQPAWLENLRQAPDNPITQAAWQAYRALYNPIPPNDPALGKLRLHYAGQIAVLLQAAHWADQPHPQASCSEDPDQDGQVECLLASEQVFAVFELDLGGYVSFLFVRDQQGRVHQLVAPSSLLISGSSSPATWNFEQGMLADPRIIPGAFLKTPAADETRANASIREGQVALDIPGQSIRKVFDLLPDGIALTLTGIPPGQTYPMSIALTLDPWHRFQPDWQQGYHSDQSDLSWHFFAPDGTAAELITDANLSSMSAFDQLDRLLRPENPDQDIPPGQMLPFPMAVVELNGEATYKVTLRLAESKAYSP